MQGQRSDMLNKVNLTLDPSLYPDTDEGNLRLYYELELLKSRYEASPSTRCFNKYLNVVTTLISRGHTVDVSTDCKLDKALRVVKTHLTEYNK